MARKPCRKRPYASKQVAESAIRALAAKHTFVFKRIYRCGRCKAWHITSTPPLRLSRRVKH
jgi:hypothetical protein